MRFGMLLAVDERSLTVDGKRGVVTIDRTSIVAAKEVPPAPVRRVPSESRVGNPLPSDAVTGHSRRHRVPAHEEEEMSSSQHERTAEVPEADALEQQREPVPEPRDPERTTTEPVPEGVEANPADVAEQSIEVPHDDEHDETGE